MKLNDFYKRADDNRTYIVRLKYKHDHEKEYRITNEVVSYSFCDDAWIWFDDWNEGETDVEVIAFIAIDILTEKLIEKINMILKLEAANNELYK